MRVIEQRAGSPCVSDIESSRASLAVNLLVGLSVMERARPSCGLAPGQHRATAHRIGTYVMAQALTLHYHLGVHPSKVLEVMAAATGIRLTQSPLTQAAATLTAERAVVQTAYQELRAAVPASATVNGENIRGHHVRGRGRLPYRVFRHEGSAGRGESGGRQGIVAAAPQVQCGHYGVSKTWSSARQDIESAAVRTGLREKAGNGRAN